MTTRRRYFRDVDIRYASDIDWGTPMGNVYVNYEEDGRIKMEIIATKEIIYFNTLKELNKYINNPMNWFVL